MLTRLPAPTSSLAVPLAIHAPSLLPCAGVGRLILDILHALSQGHDAAGHEVQGAVSPSLLLLVSPGAG